MFQAAQLLDVLLDERPGDLQLAWEAVKRQGPGWAKRIREALSSPTGPHKVLLDRIKAFLKG